MKSFCQDYKTSLIVVCYAFVMHVHDQSIAFIVHDISFQIIIVLINDLYTQDCIVTVSVLFLSPSLLMTFAFLAAYFLLQRLLNQLCILNASLFTIFNELLIMLGWNFTICSPDYYIDVITAFCFYLVYHKKCIRLEHLA